MVRKIVRKVEVIWMVIERHDISLSGCATIKILIFCVSLIAVRWKLFLGLLMEVSNML